MSVQKAVYSLFKNGYAVLPSFLSPKKCNEAIKEIDRLIDQYKPTKDQMSLFTTKETHTKNDYFLKSSEGVNFFFQEKAFQNGQLIKPKHHSINKIGHALHQKNQIFSSITYQQQIRQICKRVGNLNPVVVQSMAILKPPEIGGQVPQHQDSTFLYDDPETLLAFWIPLQDATLKNGCLWGIPGSHKNKLYKRSKINWETGSFYTQNLHQKDYKDQDFIPIQMQKGSIAMFTGRFLHKSLGNSSNMSRYAYTWHLKDGRTRWSPENWLQRQKFPSTPFSF